MKVSRRTIQRWVEQHGFPAVRFPSTAYWTSPAAIDLWLLSIHKMELEARKAAAHANIPHIEL
jgi:hypothetical protein